MQERAHRGRFDGAWPPSARLAGGLLTTLIASVALSAVLLIWLADMGSNGGGRPPRAEPVSVTATASPMPTAAPTTPPATAPAGSPSASPTSPTTPAPMSPTPSPAPTASPFTLFAKEIADAVAAGDGDFFWSHARTHPVTCTPEAAGMVYGCVGLPENAIVSVFPVTNPFEGTAYRQDQLIGLVSAWLRGGYADLSDEFGPGAPVLYATAVTSWAPGHDVYNAVITSIRTGRPSGTYRTVLVSSWEEVDGRWEHVRLWTSETFFSEGSPSAEEWRTGDCTTAATPCRDWSQWP